MTGIRDLYIHIPFCRSRCGYCGFVSSVPRSGGMDGYVALLEREAVSRFGLSFPAMRTVYIGGGTPTFLPEAELERLCRLLRRFIDKDTAEVSIESTPESITLERARSLFRAGVTRFTMGLQSGDPSVLRQAGRRTGFADVARAVDDLKTAGVSEIGIDLIIGLPGETQRGWGEMIGRLIGLDVSHISAYLLTIEPGTPFAEEVRTGRMRLQGDQRSRRMLQHLSLRLERAGYRRYEVSNFGKNGSRALHNLRIWRGAPYEGLGMGAVACDGKARRFNPDRMERYRSLLEGAVSPQIDRLTVEKRIAEALLLGLRTDEGVSLNDLQRKTGYAPPPESVNRLLAEGLLRQAGERLHATRKGWFWLDDLVTRMMC